MRLVPGSRLYGLPARTLRDFLRYVGAGNFTRDTIEWRMKISAAESDIVLAGLLADHSIQRSTSDDESASYVLMATGRQLAAASFASPIPRATGDRLLAELLARAQDRESQRAFAFRVTQVSLFGSMLTDSVLVSDVDIAVAIASPYPGDQHHQVAQQRIDLAQKNGKRFRNMIESVVWPRVEVMKYLKGSERYLSLHGTAEVRLLQCPYEVLYEADPYL